MKDINSTIPYHTIPYHTIPCTTQPTLRSGDDGDVAGLGADVVEDGALNHRDDKVRALSLHIAQHTIVQQIEDNSSVPGLNCSVFVSE